VPHRLLSIPPILERGVSEVASVFDLFEVGVYCVNLGGYLTYVNPAGEALLGWDAGELLGRHAHDTIHHSQPDGSPFPREECPFYQALRCARAERELGDVFWSRSGSALYVAHSIAPLYEDGEHVGAIVVFADVGERHRDAELLRTRAAQQAALAELGLRALGGGALQDLLQHASALVAEMLDVEFSQVLELIDEHHGLRLVAGVGWPAGTAAAAHVGLDCDSEAGFALASDRPAVVNDWRAETRFRAPSLLREHGVASGVSVVIHGRDRPWGTEPWGVVGAHTRRPRTFTAEDVCFLQSVANTLALAIERSEAEQELRQRDAEITQLAEGVSRLADERQRIMADALDTEDRTREQISQLLHDEVLQSLLTARQDLARETRNGSAQDGGGIAQAREAVVEAISELRNAVVALHPVTLAQGGLAAAIKATADVHARRGGFEVTLDLAPDASGIRDQLIVSLAQELLNNVAQHAHASDVTITLRRTRDDIVFEVADDGRGMDPARPREALDRGHVGLASIAMRVESCGGRLELTTDAGEGTRVRVVLPADMPTDGPGR
jgi:PAS domain S-box-containing protein